MNCSCLHRQRPKPHKANDATPALFFSFCFLQLWWLHAHKQTDQWRRRTNHLFHFEVCQHADSWVPSRAPHLYRRASRKKVQSNFPGKFDSCGCWCCCCGCYCKQLGATVLFALVIPCVRKTMKLAILLQQQQQNKLSLAKNWFLNFLIAESLTPTPQAKPKLKEKESLSFFFLRL